ncbi:hypothetical protein WMF39_42055 [Sorangium sp. So ce1504]|uniref:hypothetical protein n=1 Tax=Sorangium sp. So ce1504 TaxID=3133337 RepID=UPI003F5F476D
MRRTLCVLVTAAAAMLLSGAALAQSPQAAAPAKAADAKKPEGKAGNVAKAEARGLASKSEHGAGDADLAPGKSEHGAGKADLAPGKSEHAAGKADLAPGKSEHAAGKADLAPGQADKAAGNAEVEGSAAATEKEKAREIRKKSQREAARTKVVAALENQPMTEAMKQELRRHARRIARLERVNQLARDEKDQASSERVSKLIDKENARHETWMANFNAKAVAKAGAK